MWTSSIALLPEEFPSGVEVEELIIVSVRPPVHVSLSSGQLPALRLMICFCSMDDSSTWSRSSRVLLWQL